VFREEGYLARVPREAEVMLGAATRGDDDGRLARELAAADESGRLTRIVRLEPVVTDLPGDLLG
jgi:hypothetical protein